LVLFLQLYALFVKIAPLFLLRCNDSKATIIISSGVAGMIKMFLLSGGGG